MVVVLPTKSYEKKFKTSSETGERVLWLKKNTPCDCFDSDSLIHSEPNPICLKCFGTGYTRQIIYTSKIRNEIQNQRAESFEETYKNSTINERRRFYIPELYREMSTTDLIIFLDSDLTPISIYKIINKEQFRTEDFIFYEITGEKINFVSSLKNIFENFEKLITLSDEEVGEKQIESEVDIP